MTLPPLQSVELSNNNVVDVLAGLVAAVMAAFCSTADALAMADELGCMTDTGAGGMAFECRAAM